MSELGRSEYKNVELVVTRSWTADACAAGSAAGAGEIGNGRVFVLPVGQSFRKGIGELERD